MFAQPIKKWLFLTMMASFSIVDAIAEKEIPKIVLSNDGKMPFDLNASGGVVGTFNAAVFGQFLSVDDSYRLVSNQIESWQWNSENMSYVLKLRKDLVFHNGRRANSSDLLFSIFRGFCSDKRNYFTIWLDSLVAAQDSGKSIDCFPLKLARIPGTKIIDEYTVEVKLKAPNPTFLYAFIIPYFALVPSEELESDFFSWKKLPIGAGPFRVTDINKDESSIILTRTVQVPKSLNRISVTSRKTEKLPLISFVDSPELLTSTYSRRTSMAPVAIWCLKHSSSNKLGNNGNFRKAIHLAIDREALSSGFDDVTPSYIFIPSTIGFPTKHNLETGFRLKEARKHLARLPVELKKELERGIEISVYLKPVDGSAAQKRLQLLKSQIERLGFKVHWYFTDQKFINKELAEKVPFQITGIVTDEADPTIMMRILKRGSPYPNNIPSDDEGIQQLFEKAAKSTTRGERILIARDMASLIDKHSWIIPLLEFKEIYYVDDSKVDGLGNQNQPIAFFLDRVRLKQ